MLTHSAERWSTATNTAACPSPVQVAVKSVPHISSTRLGMMVPSWFAAPRRAYARGREQPVFARSAARRGAWTCASAPERLAIPASGYQAFQLRSQGYEAIVTAACEAWNSLIANPARITEVLTRQWATIAHD